MSHRDECPSPDYARDRGREDYRTGWYSPYAMGDCYEAQRAYDDGMRAARRHEQSRREMREMEEAAEMQAYYDAIQAAAQQAEYDAMIEAEYDAWCTEEMQRQQWEEEQSRLEPDPVTQAGPNASAESQSEQTK